MQEDKDNCDVNMGFFLLERSSSEQKKNNNKKQVTDISRHSMFGAYSLVSDILVFDLYEN